RSRSVTSGSLGPRRNGYRRSLPGRVVSDPPLQVDIRSPPPDLDGRIEWFGRVSDRLVLLEEYPLSDIAFAVDQIAASVHDHLREVAGNPERRDGIAGPSTGPAALLRADHG